VELAQFQQLYDFIHIDEKWFELANETQRMLLVRGEGHL
jgi:hypothetical protein